MAYERPQKVNKERVYCGLGCGSTVPLGVVTEVKKDGRHVSNVTGAHDITMLRFLVSVFQ